MNSKNLLVTFSLTVLVLFFGIKGIILAAGYLIPLTFAVMLTLISIPLAQRLEGFGFSRTLASLSCMLLAVLVYLTFFFLISVQGHNIAVKWPEMREKIEPKLAEVFGQIEDKTGFDLQSQIPGFAANSKKSGDEDQEKSEEVEQESEGKNEFEGQSDIPGKLAPLAMNIFSFFNSSLITFVYMFFLLSFRKKVKDSILLFFEIERRSAVKKILDESKVLVLNFLGGRSLLIIFLAVIYTIGLSIAGVENAILISLMAAFFSIIPFLGAIAGLTLTIVFTLLGGGDTTSFIIVIVTYGVAQFIETNILQPYVVGDKVNLNPMMTIPVIVAGGMIWGIAGMVLSIPIAGLLKIIFDAVEPLKPIGYLLGGEDIKESKEPGPVERWGKKMWGNLTGK